MGEKRQCSLIPKPIEWLKGNVIGSGSFGTVYLAINSATGAFFVAKTTKSNAGVKSLNNEANILQTLDSPYIIKCIGKDVSFTENGETNYTVFFEYMAGGSLSDFAEKFGGTLNEKLIRLYTKGILQGLKYLHKNGIVHSDIKCKNVLLGESGTIKLADFGCARRLISTKTKSKCCNAIGGTPLWMAPEVLKNEGFDFTADIWSLGCTVIEMATGSSPWGGNASNPIATVLKIAQGNEVPEFPKHFSAEGLDFLAKCLERDPGKRWTSERLLEHSFVNTLRQENAFSPKSTIDFAIYDDQYSDDDDEDYEFVNRIPFSVKWHFHEKKIMPSECFWESSDNWITIRSR